MYELQTLEAARSRRLTDILNTHCKKTLQAIMAHKWSWPFNTPVDITVYKDYLETVSKPMDFGTVKRQLESGQYTTPDAFLADVRLVFNNAQAYNKPGSDVFVMANTLQEKFEDKYSAAVAPKVTEEATVYAAETLAARRRHAGAAAAAGGPQREAAESRLAFLIRYIDQVGACVADAKSAAAALCAPLTRAEKEQLCSTLGRLPQHHFEAAVGLVLHHHPGLQPFDDVGFDLDMLDSLTLRQLQSFVAAATAAEEEQRRGRAASGGKEETAQVTWPGIPLGAGVKQFVVKRKKASASPVAAPAAEGGAADAATPAARMVTMPPAQSAAPVGSVAPSGAALWSQNGGDGRAAAAEDGKEGRGSPDEEMVDDGEGGGCDDEAEAGSEEEEGGEEDGEEGDDDDDDDEQ